MLLVFIGIALSNTAEANWKVGNNGELQNTDNSYALYLNTDIEAVTTLHDDASITIQFAKKEGSEFFAEIRLKIEGHDTWAPKTQVITVFEDTSSKKKQLINTKMSCIGNKCSLTPSSKKGRKFITNLIKKGTFLYLSIPVELTIDVYNFRSRNLEEHTNTRDTYQLISRHNNDNYKSIQKNLPI